MDVLYFLTERISFIRAFYDGAAAPFRETMRLIEAKEPPFKPPYSEDDEPPFLAEWIEADTATDVLGRTCVSMLSDSLKLYFLTWERLLRMTCQKAYPKDFKQGFIHGYRVCFQAACGMDWSEAPAKLDLLEQITLARNDAQHPQEITNMRVRHTATLKKPGRSLLFVTDAERVALLDVDGGPTMFLAPELHVSRENLLSAIDEVEKLARWLEGRLLEFVYPGRAREMD